MYVCWTVAHLGPTVLLGLGSEVAGHTQPTQELPLKLFTGDPCADHPCDPPLRQPSACPVRAHLALKPRGLRGGRVQLGGSPATPTDRARTLTQLLQHLVTLVQHKMLHVPQVEAPVPHESQDPAWGPHYHMGTVLLQHFFVLLDGEAPEEHRHLFRWRGSHFCLSRGWKLAPHSMPMATKPAALPALPWRPETLGTAPLKSSPGLGLAQASGGHA